MQRVQSQARFVPRQFCYLLPFRVQVCRIQSSLPCFPSTVLFIMASPFSLPGACGQVPRLHRYYEDATPSGAAYRSLMVSPRGFRVSLIFVLSLARSFEVGDNLSGQGHSLPASPIPASLHGQHRTSQVPCWPIPCLCHVPRPRPGRNALANAGASMLPSLQEQRRPQY